MKKPIIIPTNIGPSGTLILDRQTGLLFENNNADDLVTKIEELLDNKEFAQQLGLNAYDYVIEHFSNDARMNKTIELYDEISRKEG